MTYDKSRVISGSNSIMLHGDGHSHEDFHLEPEAVRGWCKAVRKPYDVVVTAILLRASQLAGAAIEVR
jgi:hypothetical protein